MYEDILYDVQDPVATITLNRPEKLNALRDRTSRELMHALAEAQQDPRVVGIVLTGAGRGFCGGLDMQALATIQEAGEIASYREAGDVPQAEPGAPLAEDLRFGYGYIMSLRKPVVVAVNGACAGWASRWRCSATCASPRNRRSSRRSSPSEAWWRSTAWAGCCRA